MFRIAALAALVLLLPACAARVAPPPVVPTLPQPRPPLPPGATPDAGASVPRRLADGSFPTPNRDLTPNATLWHLRGGLNVAALACRGAGEAALTAGYNNWLRTRAAELKAAEAALAAEYRARGVAGEPATAWRARYDGDMTRLYNYWAQEPARPGLCAAAPGVLAEAGATGADLGAGAAGWLSRLDRPVTDYYAAFDAWRSWGEAPPPAPTPGAAGAPPRLEVDPSVFR